MLSDLRRHGAHVSDLAQLLPSWSPALVDATPALLGLIDGCDGCNVPLSMPEVFRAGLDPALLSTVESYVQAPPALIGAHVRRDRGSQVTDDLKCWHLDYEDVRMLRLIVYLCPVDEHNGPFEHIPLEHASRCADLVERARGDAESNPMYAPVGDEVMAARVDPRLWATATGPVHRSVLADTARLFHRTRPHTSQRIALTFTYTSRSPRFPVLRRNAGLDAVLDGRQARCLFVEQRDDVYASSGNCLSD